MNKDSLGDRMKSFYEDRYRFTLPRRTNILIRIDGKAFHTYTRKLKRPFDEDLIDDMVETTKYLCKNIQGAVMGYVQSDEISILITDYQTITTNSWFDNNLQKMCSISASLATAKFNQVRAKRGFDTLAMFDSRVFIIPQKEEVVNYFLWRQQDATRNSISMVAQSNFSSSQLHKKTTNEMQDLLMTQKGINWNNFPSRNKRGSAIIKKTTNIGMLIDAKTKKPISDKYVLSGECTGPTAEAGNIDQIFKTFTRSSWEAVETPIFSQDRDFITDLF